MGAAVTDGSALFVEEHVAADETDRLEVTDTLRVAVAECRAENDLIDESEAVTEGVDDAEAVKSVESVAIVVALGVVSDVRDAESNAVFETIVEAEGDAEPQPVPVLLVVAEPHSEGVDIEENVAPEGVNAGVTVVHALVVLDCVPQPLIELEAVLDCVPQPLLDTETVQQAEELALTLAQLDTLLARLGVALLEGEALAVAAGDMDDKPLPLSNAVELVVALAEMRDTGEGLSMPEGEDLLLVVELSVLPRLIVPSELLLWLLVAQLLEQGEAVEMKERDGDEDGELEAEATIDKLAVELPQAHELTVAVLLPEGMTVCVALAEEEKRVVALKDGVFEPLPEVQLVGLAEGDDDDVGVSEAEREERAEGDERLDLVVLVEVEGEVVIESVVESVDDADIVAIDVGEREVQEEPVDDMHAV